MVSYHLTGYNKDLEFELLPWWQIFVGETFSIKLERHVSKNTAHKNRLLGYYTRLKPTLFILRKALDIDLNKSIDKVEPEISKKHWRIINFIKSENN